MILGLVCVSSMVLLGACTNSGSTKEEGKKAIKTEKKSKKAKKQVLNLIETAEIPTMDTALNVDGVSSIVMNNVFEGLYRLKADGELELGVASEEPTISEDKLTYTYKLKSDAVWSNGDPVTAQDFVYAWQKTVDPNSGAAYGYMFDGIFKNATEIQKGELPPSELGAKAINDKTLEIQLVANAPYLKPLLASPTFFPQNEKFVISQGEKFSTNSETMIYNGPFTLTKWDGTGLSWVYKKNPTYWDKKVVQLETINVDVVKETSARINLYEADEMDRTVLEGEYVSNYLDNPELQSIPESTTFYFQFNRERSGKETPLNNKNIRKALALSFDKAAYIESVLQNDSIVANGLIPEGLAQSPTDKKDFREAAGDLQEFDIKEAQKAWKQGLAELGVNSLDLELLSGDTDSAKKTSEFFQSQWQTNLPGLKLSLKNVPFKVRLELDGKQDYDIELAGWSADYPDPNCYLDIFQTGKSYNTTGFSNEKYNQLVNKINTSDLADLDTRWKDMLKAEKIILDDYNIAPIYQRSKSILQKSYVKGIVNHMVGADYSYKWAYVTEK